MNKTILTYGLLSGAVASLLMVGTALYFKSSTDHANSEVFGYAGILLSMLFVFMGVRTYRDRKGSSVLSFGEAFRVALLITVISCVCYVVAWMVVYETIMPDFMEKYVAQTLENMKNSGATADQVRQEAAKMEDFLQMYKNPLFRAAITFLEPFHVGVIVSLISSLVLRRKA
jgi:hypothetical protein